MEISCNPNIVFPEGKPEGVGSSCANPLLFFFLSKRTGNSKKVGKKHLCYCT